MPCFCPVFSLLLLLHSPLVPLSIVPRSRENRSPEFPLAAAVLHRILAIPVNLRHPCWSLSSSFARTPLLIASLFLFHAESGSASAFDLAGIRSLSDRAAWASQEARRLAADTRVLAVLSCASPSPSLSQATTGTPSP